VVAKLNAVYGDREPASDVAFRGAALAHLRELLEEMNP